MKASKSLIFLVAPILLAGCGVTLEANRVLGGPGKNGQQVNAPSTIPGSGIVYALPKTVFEIVQPAKFTVPTNGLLHDIYESCLKACDATNDRVSDDACKLSVSPLLKLPPPELRSVSVADYSQLYQVSPRADLFQSLDFQFEIASNGVLDKADAKASNMTYEVASALVTTAVKAVGMSTWAMAANLDTKKSEKKRSCYLVSKSVSDLEEKQSPVLECSLAREVRSCMASYEKDIEKERAALNALYDRAAGGTVSAKALPLLAANRRERIEAALSRRDDAATSYGLGVGNPMEGLFQIVIPMEGPPEYSDFTTKVTLGPSVASGLARIVAVSDNGPRLLPLIKDALKAQPRVYVLNTTMPKDVGIVDGKSSPIESGYRYRIPTLAEISLTVFKDESQATYEFGGPFVDKRIIAQYGPIAALPSSFKGKGGRLMVKHWPESGGLQSVEIGADPLPASTFTNVTDEVFNQYKARKEKADAAAAAASADPELDALTRQQKILSLKKEIKDLEAALKTGQ